MKLLYTETFVQGNVCLIRKHLSKEMTQAAALQSVFLQKSFQECEKYSERQKELRASQDPGAQRYKPKKTVQYYQPTVEQFEDEFYLISSEVWCLGGGVPRQLAPDEIQSLPVNISWKGQDCYFRSDRKECIRLLCQIVSDMNLMQNQKFVSFPLGKNIFIGF